MPIIIPANSAAGGVFDVDNSIRFNGTNQYLSRTISSASTPTKLTTSFWVKRSKLGATQRIVTQNNTGGSNNFYWRFETDDKLVFWNQINGSTTWADIKTNREFRDTSAWYHICCVWDSTQGTEANRMKLYVNGVQETSLETNTYPSQNTTFGGFANTSCKIDVGYYRTSNIEYYSGYLSEFVIADGQALAPTDFGEFDEDSGIWKAKAISGLTFGTNGSYLNFKSSSELGTDVSGNSNTFTENNLTAVAQSTDTCTNNFSTINPLIVMNTDTVYSEGNLIMTPGGNTGNWQIGFSSIAVSVGKWYVETKMIGGNYVNGISETTSNQLSASGPEHFIGGFTKEIGYYSQSGNKFVENSQSSYGASYTNGDIIGMALDLDSGTRTITFFKNGASQGAITLPSSMETMTFGMSVNQGSSSAQFNFGNPPFSISSGNTDANDFGNFEYAPPSGHLALCTKNLSEALS